MFINIMIALGFASLISQWNVQSGLAVGLAGIFIAMMAARFQIGPMRLFELAVAATFGIRLPPIEVPESSAPEPEDDELDEISRWIRRAWRSDPPQFLMSMIIVLTSVIVGITVAVSEYRLASAGGPGMILPLKSAAQSIDLQAVFLGCAITALLSSVFLAVSSSAMRRILLLAGFAGGGMGGIIDISAGQFGPCAIVLSVLFLLNASLFAVIVMGAFSLDRKSTSDIKPNDDNGAD